jgi:hypothetical protein
MFCKAHGGGKLCQFPKVVTRVRQVRLCFAKHTAGANDVNISVVVARVLLGQHCFAQHTAGANDVNISVVVARVRHKVGCDVVMAVKLGSVSSPMLLKHSAGGEEPGGSGELRAMCQKGQWLVGATSGDVSSRGSK